MTFVQASLPLYSAKMQSNDWNDLKYLLALCRAGKLKPAARALSTSDTTVARRIKALEQRMGTPLFVRSATGRYEPTDAALAILPRVEAMEAETRAITDLTSEHAKQITGRVRISSVPIIVNRVLVPNLASLHAAHPNLQIELVPSAQNLDLSKREADLAVRFARPAEGGLRTKAQKLGVLHFAPFRPNRAEGSSPFPWITYEDASATLPQARWLEAIVQSADGQPAPLKVSDVETAFEAAAHGLGQTLLPAMIAEQDERLERLPDPPTLACPARDVWLLSHLDQSARPSVQAVKDWLAGLSWT